MFAPISVIFGLLFFASTLPNGIRIGDLPARADSVEILAGYASGGTTDFEFTPAADAIFRTAYASGGTIQFVNELDRTAFRIVIPPWAATPVFEQLPALFNETTKPGLGDKTGGAPSDFRAKVEAEIREALLGAGSSEADYGTSEAFILTSTSPPKSMLDALAAIPKRGSSGRLQDEANRLTAERTLRFKSDLPEGAVIFAAPEPAVFYKQWYLLLLIDRLIQRSFPLKVKTSLPLNVRTYYYRIEMPLNAGQFPEQAEANLLQELERLQFTPASQQNMNAARQGALAYLDSGEVKEWFESHGLAERRTEGVQWIGSMTTDDIRAAVRDLLIMNRVIASWAPKPKQTGVSVEPLTPAASSSRPAPASSSGKARTAGQPDEGRIVTFPAHMDSPTSTAAAERLSSGVSVVPSNINAVFVAGGALTRFDHEPAADDIKQFSGYRAERILVLSPSSSLDRARQLWSAFKGSTSGPGGVPKGNVSTGDLPGLFVLKTMLDLDLIDAGWSRDAQLRIDATTGSALQIIADEEKKAQILEWIKSIAKSAPSEKYFAWVREVAIHRFHIAMPDLQALTWERDPLGTVPDLSGVNSGLVQDVARIYF